MQRWPWSPRFPLQVPPSGAPWCGTPCPWAPAGRPPAKEKGWWAGSLSGAGGEVPSPRFQRERPVGKATGLGLWSRARPALEGLGGPQFSRHWWEVACFTFFAKRFFFFCCMTLSSCFLLKNHIFNMEKGIGKRKLLSWIRFRQRGGGETKFKTRKCLWRKLPGWQIHLSM